MGCGMIRDLVLPTTKPSEWPELRDGLRRKIVACFGERPRLPDPVWKDNREETWQGLQTKRFRLELVPGFPVEGTLIGPAEGETPRHRLVMCIHGTDWERGHRNVMDPEGKPNRVYALELARRGFHTLAVDQIGFGEGFDQNKVNAEKERFYELYPEWSLDGARHEVFVAALDLALQRLEVREDRVGAIGNSLGGRGVIYLAALDERIAAAVPSTGISPNYTNVYRALKRQGVSHLPILDKAVAENGRPLFDFHELMALVAPRGLLLLEPFNDPYNPYIEAGMRCFEAARHVYTLLDAEPHLQMLTHGDGHDTVPRVRRYAYAWMESMLDA